MKKENSNRTVRLHVRFSPSEYEKISSKFSRSTCRKISEYARKILLDKPVTTLHRNQSLDDLMRELVALRSELNAIANNYNQVVKRLHTMQDLTDLKPWLILNQKAQQFLHEKVTEIKAKISQINDQWLA